MKYQFGFKHLFCLRLLRSAYLTFLKTGCKYQNVITSGIYRTHYTYEIINPDTCQSQINLPISIWATLYELLNYVLEAYYSFCKIVISLQAECQLFWQIIWNDNPLITPFPKKKLIHWLLVETNGTVFLTAI